MNYQQRTNWCGPASVQNCLELFGIKRTQAELAELCGTGRGGTDETGIRRALLTSGVCTWEYRQPNLDRLDTPALVCVNRWEHWVLVAALAHVEPRSFLVVDPARTTYNRSKNGIRVWTKQRLALKMRPPPSELEAYYWLEAYI